MQCSLMSSGLSDMIDVTLDMNGNFLAVGLTTWPAYCSENERFSNKRVTSFNTTIKVVQTSVAPAVSGIVESRSCNSKLI